MPRKKVTRRNVTRRKVKKRLSLRSMLARSPEIDGACRQLATLVLAQQESPLGVRQLEQLRRALTTAGDALGWTEAAAGDVDSVVEVGKDIMTMAKGGAKFMAHDLAEELARKRTEVSQIHDVAASALKLSEDPDASYPAEITYSYTARDAFRDTITKTETLTVNDAREALSASETIERSTTSRGKLADLMIIALEQKQVRLDGMTRTLPDFLESLQELLREVIANLE